MPVNSAYRDFFQALDAIEHGADTWSAYEQRYLRRHRAVLTAYWRQCWGADEERMREMVRGMRPGDYRELRESLTAAQVEQLVGEALRRCAGLVDLPEPQVDLLVGRFSPDAFLFEVNRRWHIGIGLERFAHFAALPPFVAHEYGHYARRVLAPEAMTLGERVIAEGVAGAFAEAAYPELALSRHLRTSRRRIHEIRQLEPKLWAALASVLGAPDENAFAGILDGAHRWRDFPPRFGVCLGYWAVKHFARSTDRPATSRDLLAAPASVILDTYPGRTSPNGR